VACVRCRAAYEFSLEFAKYTCIPLSWNVQQGPDCDLYEAVLRASHYLRHDFNARQQRAAIGMFLALHNPDKGWNCFDTESNHDTALSRRFRLVCDALGSSPDELQFVLYSIPS
jgi:hypothetical protein